MLVNVIERSPTVSIGKNATRRLSHKRVELIDFEVARMHVENAADWNQVTDLGNDQHQNCVCKSLKLLM